jgi:hypothetical protein
MARTKDDVTKADADSAATPAKRGRKSVTSADTGAGVVKTPGKRGRPKKAEADKKTKAPSGRPRGRPPGSGAAKPKPPPSGRPRGRPPGGGAKAKAKQPQPREVAPAVPATESTAGADRRRAKGVEIQSLPAVKHQSKTGDRQKTKADSATPRKTTVEDEGDDVEDEDGDEDVDINAEIDGE